MDEYLTQTQVIERGWTKSMITKLLGAPDKTVQQTRTRLYHLFGSARVLEVEGTEPFTNLKQKALTRSAKGKAAADVKRQQLLDDVSKWEPVVQVVDMNKARELSIDAYNYHSYERGRYEGATSDSDKSFLDRITVNHIRHNLTDYHGLLSLIAGRVGTHEAYEMVKAAVLDRIGEVYPDLKQECERQQLRFC